MRAVLWIGALLVFLAFVTWLVFEATVLYALVLVVIGAVMLLWGVIALFRAR